MRWWCSETWDSEEKCMRAGAWENDRRQSLTPDNIMIGTDMHNEVTALVMLLPTSFFLHQLSASSMWFVPLSGGNIGNHLCASILYITIRDCKSFSPLPILYTVTYFENNPASDYISIFISHSLHVFLCCKSGIHFHFQKKHCWSRANRTLSSNKLYTTCLCTWSRPLHPVLGYRIRKVLVKWKDGRNL